MQFNLEKLQQLVGRSAGGVMKLAPGNPAFRACYTIGAEKIMTENTKPDLTVGMTGFESLESTPELLDALREYSPGNFALFSVGFLYIQDTMLDGFDPEDKIIPPSREVAECLVNLLGNLIENQFQMPALTNPVINFHFHPDNQTVHKDAVELTFTISMRCSAEVWQAAFMQKSLELTAASEYHKSLVDADPLADAISEADISGKRVLQ